MDRDCPLVRIDYGSIRYFGHYTGCNRIENQGCTGCPVAGTSNAAHEDIEIGGFRGFHPDIPDGSDDDVVARQLREAAEKETDPELKAKLWEEYRRYKRGTT